MLVSEKLVYKFFLKQRNSVIFDEWLEKLEKNQSNYNVQKIETIANW